MEIADFVKIVSDNQDKNLIITTNGNFKFFEETIKTPKSKRFKIKPFLSTFGHQCFCINNQKKRGYDHKHLFNVSNIGDVINLEVYNPYSDENKMKNYKKVLNKIDNNLWESLKDEIEYSVNNINDNRYDSDCYLSMPKFVNIKTKLKSCYNEIYANEIIKNIEDAIENKKAYKFNWTNGYSTKNRDYSISIEIIKGELKGFFSSEYKNCGNGDYYLLINPTTAIFYETD